MWTADAWEADGMHGQQLQLSSQWVPFFVKFWLCLVKVESIKGNFYNKEISFRCIEGGVCVSAPHCYMKTSAETVGAMECSG